MEEYSRTSLMPPEWVVQRVVQLGFDPIMGTGLVLLEN